MWQLQWKYLFWKRCPYDQRFKLHLIDYLHNLRHHRMFVSKAIRRLTFAVEEIWHPDFYPLQRSDVALDRISQLVSELGTECREINVVKWPRLQDDTLIERTYSEMQAGKEWRSYLRMSRRSMCSITPTSQQNLVKLHQRNNRPYFTSPSRLIMPCPTFRRRIQSWPSSPTFISTPIWKSWVFSGSTLKSLSSGLWRGRTGVSWVINGSGRKKNFPRGILFMQRKVSRLDRCKGGAGLEIVFQSQ